MTYLAEEAYIEKKLEFKNTHLLLTTSGFDDSLQRFITEYVQQLA